MRAAVVVGMVALLCGVVLAGPKHASNKKGTFDAYVEGAPDEPRAEAPATRTRLSVVFLIDRSAAISETQLANAKVAAHRVHERLDAGDMAAVLAFDEDVTELLRPSDIKQRKQFKRALEAVSPGQGRHLAGALVEAREYLARARDRKVILLFTDERDIGDVDVHYALRAIHGADVTLVIVGLPGADQDALWFLATRAEGRVTMLSGERFSAFRRYSLEDLERTVDILHAGW